MTPPVWELAAVRTGIGRQADELARRTAAGASLVGWKLGVGARESMRRAGITAPLLGFLTSATVMTNGGSVSLAGWVRPMLEPEIAIHLGADVPGDAGPEQCAAAIAAVGPAIELADVDAPLSDLAAVVAGDIFHRGVVLGDDDLRRPGGRVADLRVTVTRGAEVVAETDDVTALTGSPVDAVMHVARWLEATGRRLQAGQVIIGGSVVPILPVRPGDIVAYRCDPLGVLQVSFTD